MSKRLTLGGAVVMAWPAFAGALIPAAYQIGAGDSAVAQLCSAGIVWMIAVLLIGLADLIYNRVKRRASDA